MKIYLFKVKDYTTILIGQYDESKNEYFVQRGDGTKYSYSNDKEFSRIEWSKFLIEIDETLLKIIETLFSNMISLSETESEILEKTFKQ